MRAEVIEVRGIGEEVHIATIADRPDLLKQAQHVIDAAWPGFMLHDPVANRHWFALYTTFPDYQFVLCDDAGAIVAAGNSIPFVCADTYGGLPSGWDAVLAQGMADHAEGRRPTTLSALSITIASDHRGGSISATMIRAMKDIAAAHGLAALVAPVRPSLKHRYPLTPIERYVAWTHGDGVAPFDPWLRAHWRLGAETVGIAPESMAISGTVAAWEEWAGMRFPESGAYIVPGALVPVTIDRERDEGRYVEPNVWMRHTVAPGDRAAPRS